MIQHNPTLVNPPCKNVSGCTEPEPEHTALDWHSQVDLLTEHVARERFSNLNVRACSPTFRGYQMALLSCVRRLRNASPERADLIRSVTVSALYCVLDGISHETIDADIDAVLDKVRA